MPWLINAAQADKFRKSQKSLIIFDASLHMASAERDAKKEFEEKHILGAKFFDIDFFNDPASSLPHSILLEENIISEKLSKLGIRNDFKLIFYDNSDLRSACRALWMMKLFGHNPNQLYLLDGGLASWEKYKGKVESGPITFTPRIYQAKFQLNHLVNLDQMKTLFKAERTQMIDVRHPVRFSGGVEPRQGIRQGHIPGSQNYPYTNFFDKDGKFLPLDKIKNLLESVSIKPSLPTVAMCGSGITAPILDFVLDQMGTKHHVVYPGSWTEWGADHLYENEISLDERPVKTVLDFDLPKKIV